MNRAIDWFARNGVAANLLMLVLLIGGGAAAYTTVQGDSMLVERSVEPIQTVEEQTYLAPTLDPDTRVITTDLRVQTDSMDVRVSR